MTRTHLELEDPTAPHLMDAEQQDFDFIIQNARVMGWLAFDQTIVASRRACGILVRSSNTGTADERCYDDPARWLNQLLHDLARGAWKIPRSNL